jgi:3',5'-cyclic AMP phosphodiesterase CpdA
MPYVPIVQLLHISDLHMGPPKTKDLVQRVRNAVRQKYPILGPLIVREAKGFASHDKKALEFLEASISHHINAPDQDKWRAISVLVVTGDLTTWGDQINMKLAQQRIRQISNRAGITTEPVVIYGNHDVWPGTWPGSAEEPELAAAHSRLRDPKTGDFPETWPLGPLWTSPLKHLGGEFGIYSLNSIIHERTRSVLAQGNIGKDRYWESVAAHLNDQTKVLIATAKPGVRALLTHHPIHHTQLVTVHALRGMITPLPAARAAGGRAAWPRRPRSGSRVCRLAL